MNLERFNRILLSVMILPILALLGMAITLYWQMQDANATVTMIERADQRLTEALQLDQYVLDEETSVRGYEITGDPELLNRVNAARNQVANYLNFLDSEEGTAERTQLLKEIRTAYERWDHGFVTPLLEKLRSGTHVEDTQRHAESETQLRLVHAGIAGLKQIPAKRRVERIALWQEQTRRMKIILAVLAAAIGLALGLFMRYSLHEVSDAYKNSLQVLRVRTDEIYRSEQNLRTTLASIGDGVITCDPEGRVLTMNAVAQDLTGWREDEARTKPLEQVFDIVNETTRQLVENPVTRVKRLNRVVGLANHTILRRRDGSEIHIDDSGAPIRDQQGHLVGVVMVFRDITLQRRSQDALIANEKLAVAGRLAASIAHEIHNPLDSVANLLYLMSSPSTPEETSQFLEMARQELSRVTQISRAMLSLYREPRQPVEIDVADMLQSVLMLMDRRFHELGVKIEADLPEGLIVRGFPAELRQVFTNLLSNAAEAANLGGNERGSIRIKASSATSANDRTSGVAVTITDNGPGIPETIRERLFQPFFTTKAENGTGLGLWVSRGIINRHNGEISLNSDTSAGHHFTEARVFLAADPVILPETN